jgi:short-subunit dehydrogenase
MAIAVITGASSGLGHEFALQLDRAGLDELWLIARRGERLEQLKAQLRTPAHLIVADLSQPGDIAKIGVQLAERTPSIRYLVNNAGFGKHGEFAELDLEAQLGMIDVNVRAVTHLSHLSLPYMQQGGSYIQVASSAGFGPLGSFAVYAATKAYVISLSVALSVELKERGVHSIAVCPGSVETEFFMVSRGNGVARTKKLFAKKASVQAVVAQALADASAHKALSIYGFGIKVAHLLAHLMPRHMMAWAGYHLIYPKPKAGG